MNPHQQERELKKLDLSNKALKKELAWFSSYTNRFYPSVIFLIAGLAYFLTVDNQSFFESIKLSFAYTLLFALSDIIFARFFKYIWAKFIHKD